MRMKYGRRNDLICTYKKLYNGLHTVWNRLPTSGNFTGP